MMQNSTKNEGIGNGGPLWPGFPPQRLEEIATRGNGFVLALGGGAAVAAGALLPFVFNIQETVSGVSFATGSGIGAGGRFISFLFGLLLAGFALCIRYRPEFTRRVAIISLAVSLLGTAGYCLFTLIGFAGIPVQLGDGSTAQETWDPSIGALLSIGGCAACAVAALVMLRSAPRE